MNESPIDYEVLAKSACKAWWNPTLVSGWGESDILRWEPVARAVIASYLDQRAARGYVEVRANVLLPLIKKYAESQYHIAIHEDRGTNAELKAATDARDAAWRGIISILAAHAPGATEEG